MAAIGYFSNDRDINAGTKAILNADSATPALQRLAPAVKVVAKVCMTVLFLSRRDGPTQEYLSSAGPTSSN